MKKLRDIFIVMALLVFCAPLLLESPKTSRRKFKWTYFVIAILIIILIIRILWTILTTTAST